MANLFNTIYTGTLAKYTAATKEADALYMVYDESTKVKSMYHGETKVAGDFIIAETTPATPEQGTIYYIAKFGDAQKPYVGFYDGSKWVALSDSATIEALDARITVLENATKIDGTATAGSIGAKVAQLDGEETVDGSVKKQIKDAVEALDVTDAEEAGSVVVAVSEEDGKVSNVKKAVTVAVSTTTEGMEKTYDVKIGDTSVGKIDIPFCKAVLTNAVLAKMDSTVSETDGTITTPEGSTADDALILVFQKADGKFSGVKVDVELFLKEAEFKNGLVVNEHKVSVNLGESNIYLTFGNEAEGSKSIQANVVTLADAHAAAEGVEAVTGLADALDVKIVIEENEKVTAAALNDLNQRVGKNEELTTTSKVVVPAINELKSAIEGKNVAAEGDDYVSASAAGNKVTVAATASTKASLAKADTAVQTIVVETEGQEVTVSAKSTANGYTIGVTKAAYTAASDEYKTNGAFTAKGLVDSAVLKAYIADEIAKNAVYWKTLE